MESFGEFDPATPLAKMFCARISSQQFEDQASEETYSALQSLMDYMEQNPEIYKKVLARRKKEDAENAGMLSYFKSKVLETFQGENYMENSITEDETYDKLNDMQQEIGEAFNYAQEIRRSNIRFSKRLAAKRSAGRPRSNVSSKVQRTIPEKPRRQNIPSPPPYPPPHSSIVTSPLARPPIRSQKMKSKKSGRAAVPPPPPPPPPPGTFAQPKPLGERTNTINSPGRKRTPKSKLTSTPKPQHANLKKISQHGSTTSLSSIGSIQDELMTFDKKKLKSVCNLRSITGTPCHTPHVSNSLTATPVCGRAVGGFGSECVGAFNAMMIDKFRNARSPPSTVNSPSSGFNSPSGFTP